VDWEAILHQALVVLAAAIQIMDLPALYIAVLPDLYHSILVVPAVTMEQVMQEEEAVEVTTGAVVAVEGPPEAVVAAHLMQEA
jgi:hypothetical protein